MSPKLSETVARKSFTRIPELSPLLNKAPLVTIRFPPSSTVIEESMPMVMLALTVNVEPLATVTWPFIAASSPQFSFVDMVRFSPDVGGAAAVKGIAKRRSTRMIAVGLNVVRMVGSQDTSE
jgi:hypothetical protein